tara:strand:- start:11891 stop:12307 length:417 start_codon:yes stop_codon:yes gene_type:complete
MSIDETEPGRERLDDWQRGTVLDELPDADERITELEVHTGGELADYVFELANSVPPTEELKRRELYHWDAVAPEYYQGWSKKELIRRIITMEEHDEARVTGASVKYRQPPPVNPSVKLEEKKPVTYNAVTARSEANDG